MIFYVTCRPLRIPQLNEYITPEFALQHNFAGILFSYTLLRWKPESDGRMLYEVILDDSYSEADATAIKDAMIEGLKMFGSHEKTLASAAAFANSISECTWVVNGNKVEPDPDTLVGP